MWPATIAVFVVLGTLSLFGKRWAYFLFIALGVLFFPARVGFHFSPRPCEFAFTPPLILFSLTNWRHDALFGLLFLLTAMQLRRHRILSRVGLSLIVVAAFGIYVELAEGITGKGHCRLRDLVPDVAGGLAGAIIFIVAVELCRRFSRTSKPESAAN